MSEAVLDLDSGAEGSSPDTDSSSEQPTNEVELFADDTPVSARDNGDGNSNGETSDFDPEQHDWLRGDVESVPEQYRGLVPLAKNYRRNLRAHSKIWPSSGANCKPNRASGQTVCSRWPCHNSRRLILYRKCGTIYLMKMRGALMPLSRLFSIELAHRCSRCNTKSRSYNSSCLMQTNTSKASKRLT